MEFYENYLLGIFVIMVIVIDLDFGDYVCVRYFIDDVDVVEKFMIDGEIGMIYSKISFDCENLLEVFLLIFV